MKNFYISLLSFVLMLTAGSLTAQDTIYSEDFSNGIPSEYSLFDLDGNTPNSNVSQFTDAWIGLNGAAASTSWYMPTGMSNDWMITGGIDIPTLQDQDNEIRLTWEAYAPDPNFLDRYKIMITTKGPHPDSFDTQIFSVDAAGNDPAGTPWSVDLSNYTGETVYIAFINDSNDKFILYIDNVNVLEVPPSLLRRVQTTDVINPRYTRGPSVNLEFEFTNMGHQDVESFKYVFDNEAGIRDTIAVDQAELTYDRSTVEPFPEINTGFGTLNCNVTIIEVNGESVSNATFTKDLRIYDETNTVARIPLVETFTSSTCAPCLPGNENLHGILDGLTNEPVVLKWQQNFPGDGDPYCTSETIGRRFYYDINAIPNTNVDATFFNDNTNAIESIDIIGARDFGALYSIDAQYFLDPDEQSIRVEGTVTAEVDVWEGNRLMIAVKELETVDNVGTNGETEFFDVVKKVLPDLQGTALPAMQAGEEFSFDMTYTFPGDYRLPINGQEANRIDLETEHSVEEFTDLAASAWVEYPDDYQVLAATEAEDLTDVSNIESVEEFLMAPNPVGNRDLDVQLTLNEVQTVHMEVIDVSGKNIWNSDEGRTNGLLNTQIPTATLEAGTYFLKVRIGEQFFIERFVKQ